ncbi:MAG TPA: amidohydrolase [Phototrophicaceae bacterium]|jgi:amidohydrolase|nr:amidohydrolase [Phototrophicaceae bacterium]
MVVIDYMGQAQAVRDELIARRRDLHVHPELAFQEIRTAGIVAKALSDLGLEVQTGVGKTGVVAVLEGDKDGPTVLVRADMDALPIIEANKTDYVSIESGKMHACGHDGHTSIALGVAKLFVQHRDQIAGRIKFVFQPAEEIAGGALAMIEDGVLENPRPDVSLGLHLWNNLPLGTIGVAEGPTMAGSSIFKITITGHGGHGAQPQMTADPIVCAAQMITALQTIVSRNVNPADTAVVSVTMVRAGDTHNVIPQQAELTGTMRAFKTEVRDLVTRRMEEIVRNISLAMGCKAEFDIQHLTIPVVNHPEVTAKLRAKFAEMVGDEKLDPEARTMGGEDMAYLMNDIPGMFFFVGSANSQRGLDYGHHHPRFDFDEEALPLGMALLSAAIGEYVFSE